MWGCSDPGGQADSVVNQGSGGSSAAGRDRTNDSASGGSSSAGGSSANATTGKTASGGAEHSGGSASVGGSSSTGGATAGETGGRSRNSGGAAGTPTSGAAGTPTRGSGGSAGSTSRLDGGSAAARGGAPGDSGTVAPGAGGRVDSGSSTGLVDYGAKGPYEIVVEQNVGESFRNDVADDTETCKTIMGQLMGGTQVPDTLIYYPKGMDWQLYTLFRPKNLEEGKKYPVITWGDGTCSNPQTFSKILEHLASHGFLVIASNYRQVASGAVMLRAIEFMLSENENAQSALYGKVDTKMLGATGHSQGSMATVTVGADKRIVATVPIQGANASAVGAMKGPTFLIAGGKDTTVAPAGIESAFNAATVPAVYGLALAADHTTPPVSPAPLLGPITAWFKIHLANDENARNVFYGDACTLCKDSAWTVKRKNL